MKSGVIPASSSKTRAQTLPKRDENLLSSSSVLLDRDGHVWQQHVGRRKFCSLYRTSLCQPCL